jgi:hypothetical protein
VTRHLLKPMSVRLRQVFGFRSCLSLRPRRGRLVTKIRSPAARSSLGGLRRSFVTRWLVAVGLIVSLASASAQEGHPLVGTWYGDWGSTPQARHDVTVIMTWDGKAIGGTIDPGPDAVPFKTATLDSSTWTVHIEAERPAKGATAAVRYVIDGKLANLGSYNRTLSGTWTDGATRGDFKLTRD